MKLKCELCGGSNLVKTDGLFVCQQCGASYTSDEAKKLIDEFISEPMEKKVQSIECTELDSETESVNAINREHSFPDRSKAYVVSVNSDRFSVPKLCTCCLKPAEQMEKVTYHTSTRSGNIKTKYTLSTEFPLCDECWQHERAVKKADNKVTVVFILVNLFSLVAATYLISTYKIGSWYWAVLLASILGILSFVVLSLAIQFPALSSQHTGRTESVKINSPDMPEGYQPFWGPRKREVNITQIDFTFKNAGYAELFRQANKPNASTIQEINRKNIEDKINFFNMSFGVGTIVGLIFLSLCVNCMLIILLVQIFPIPFS